MSTRRIALWALIVASLASTSALAETLVTPAVAIDLPSPDLAEAAQGPALIAGDGEGVLVAAWFDARDDRVHVAGVLGDVAGESRGSLALDPSVSLEDADLAGTSGGFLLVWSDAGVIRGQRLAVAGDVVSEDGGPFDIVSAGGPFSHPRVAFGPCEWLVAYRRSATSEGPVRTACVPVDGSPLLGTSDLVDQAGDFDLIARADGTRYLLSVVDTSAAPVVRVVLTNFLGSAETDSVQLSSGEVDAGTQLITTSDQAGGRTVWFEPGGVLHGRGFADDLTLSEAAPLQLSAPAEAVSEATIASGTQTWVAWTVDGALSVRRWREPLDPIVDLEDAGVLGVAVASAGVRRLMLYSFSEEPQASDVFSRRLSGTTATEPLALTVGTSPRAEAALAVGGAGVVAAWSQSGARTPRDVYISELDADGLPVGQPTVVAGTESDESSPTLASGPDTVLLGWVDDAGSLLVRRFDALDLGTGDVGATEVCAATTGAAAPAAAALGLQGDVFTIAVESTVTGELLLALVDSLSGGPNPVCTEVLAAAAGSPRSPRLAAADGVAMAVWIEGTAGSRSVVARPIAADGTPGTAVTVVAASEDVASVALAGLGGGEWLVASERPDADEGGADLVLTRFATDGSVVEEETVNAPAGSLDTSPLAIGLGGEVLVSWRRGADPGAVHAVQYDGADIVANSLVEVAPASRLFGGPVAIGGLSVDDALVLTRELDRSAASDDEGDERLVRRGVRTDVGPVADAGGPYGGLEGDVVLLDGRGSAGLTNSELTSWSWDVAGIAATGETTNQALPDNGLLTITLTVTDGLGRTGIDQVLAPVQNVSPAVSFHAFPTVIVEGTEQTYSVMWNDPGLDEDVQLMWDFGDGRTESGSADLFDAIDHLYEEGSYTLSVFAVDKDGAESPPDVVAMTVQNGEPIVIVGDVTDIDEGSLALAPMLISDPGDDELDIEIDWDDGTVETLNAVAAPYINERSRVYPDDSGDNLFQICVTATDEAGADDVDCEAVKVSNVSPVIEGTPPANAFEGVFAGPDPVPYVADFTFTDPGDDELLSELDVDGLSGVAFDVAVDGRSAQVSFVPTLDLWRMRQPPVYTLTLSVIDDDGSTPATLEWDVTIVPLDDNGDGLPDTCANDFGVVGGPSDDDDSDGASNLEECLQGTNPTVDDRPPEAPALNGPEDGSSVATLRPVLSVKNVEGAGPYDYEFEIYDGVELFQDDLVDSAIVAEGGGAITQWQPSALDDRQQYWWRARALAGDFSGPWMDVATFTVMLPNERPSSPVGLAPEGVIMTQRPTFVWENSTDPDADTLSYTIEVYADEALTDRALLVDGIREFLASETTEYELADDEALNDNASFWWRVTTFDSRGEQSTPSDVLSFRINTANDLPGQPMLVAPEDGSTVDTNHPELVVTTVEDVDNDVLTYSFVVSPDENFETIVESIFTVEPGEDDLVRHEVGRDLQEDTLFYWRAAARDGRGLGPFVQGAFTVNQGNNPPRPPTIQAPAQGQRVGTATPELVVRNTEDPEGDAIFYDFEVHDRPTLDNIVFSAYGVEEGDEDETAVTIDDTELDDGVTYHFRARAVDENEAIGAWSPTTQFTVQIAAEVLGAPTPSSPIDGELVAAGPIELVVQNATGTPTGEVVYEFEVFGDEILNNRVYHVEDVPEGTDVTSHLMTAELPPETYWWHARAMDDQGPSRWSATVSFQIEDPTTGDGADMGADVGSDAGFDGGADGGDTGGSGGGGGEGCGCAASDGSLPPAGGLALAVLVGVALWPRRRR